MEIKNNDQIQYKIKTSVFEEMILFCQQALPKEACGLISGDKIGNTLWKMNNESERLNRFYISAHSIKQIVERMKEINEELTGVFHSHPNSPPIPSSIDIKNNSYPDIPYIIVSFYKDKVDVRCYKITQAGNVFPLEFVFI